MLSFLKKVNAVNHRNKVSKLIKELTSNASLLNSALSSVIEPSASSTLSFSSASSESPKPSSSISISKTSSTLPPAYKTSSSMLSASSLILPLDCVMEEEESTGSINDGVESIDDEVLDADCMVEDVLEADIDDESFEVDEDEGDNAYS